MAINIYTYPYYLFCLEQSSLSEREESVIDLKASNLMPFKMISMRFIFFHILYSKYSSGKIQYSDSMIFLLCQTMQPFFFNIFENVCHIFDSKFVKIYFVVCLSK